MSLWERILAFLATITVSQIFAILVAYLGNPLSMYLAIKRRPSGWIVVVITQACFICFIVWSGNWFFGGQFLCFLMGCYGVWKWKIRGEHKPAIELPSDEEIWMAARAAYERWVIDIPEGNRVFSWDEVREHHPTRAERWHDVIQAAFLRQLGQATDIVPVPREFAT